MSGILAVYALVISVLIASDIKPPPDKHYSLFAGFMHMAAGLSVGLSGLAAGYAIGIVGDAVCCAGSITRHRLTLAGRALLHEPVEDLRRHGPYSHFRRSPGSLRTDRCPDPEHEGQRLKDASRICVTTSCRNS
jgi:F0F1-type ATP synthase membrane subunit c/vacuolar-type H+-ATPase subunit K